MQRFIFQSLAAISLLAVWQIGDAAARPRYGGTLRVQMKASVGNLSPVEWSLNPAEFHAKQQLVPMIFESLVRLGEDNFPQPLLAVSWQRDSQGRRWRFRLRTGVKFHDGSALSPEIAASALRASFPGWKASAQGESLLIESETPAPDLLFDLAQARHAVFLPGQDQQIYGTGPFRLAKLEPGRRAILEANEDHWAGRPFLDGVVIEMGRAISDQRVDLELGRADFVQVWPNEMRRLPKGAKVWSTETNELIALAFERGRPASEDPRIREALALSIDRASIHGWLMHKQGEPAASLLPQKLSGYAFLYSAKTDSKRAKQLLSGSGQPRLELSYDASDPLARSMADRIAVNARDAGIAVRVSGSIPVPDLRLVRVHIRNPLPARALAEIIAAFQLKDIVQPPDESAITAVQAAENQLLASHYFIPLFHLPEIYGSDRRVKTWATSGVGGAGDLRFDDMWLDVERP